MAFSPDGKRAVTGRDDHTLKLWSLPRTPTLQHSNTPSPLATLTGHTDKVKCAAFTPDGRYLLSGSDDKTIRLWDGRTGRFIKILARQDAGVSSLSISPDLPAQAGGSKVLTGCGVGTKTNHVFAIPSGDRVASFSKHRNVVLATAISPPQKMAGRMPTPQIAATGGGSDQEIYLWDLATGQVKQKMVGKGKPAWSVGFAKDGKSIAWGTQSKTVNIWDLSLLEHSFQLRGEGREYELGLGTSVVAGLSRVQNSGAGRVRLRRPASPASPASAGASLPKRSDDRRCHSASLQQMSQACSARIGSVHE